MYVMWESSESGLHNYCNKTYMIPFQDIHDLQGEYIGNWWSPLTNG